MNSNIRDTIQAAVAWAVGIANDASHGYDQGSRWGPNYDCSSLLISAWEAAGVPVRSRGATYTGNMRRAFRACGFEVLPASGALETGDVLLNDANHTAMYIGNGQIVQASINERGGVTGGQTGDQTGREIYVRACYDYPWNCVLRYAGDGGGTTSAPGADGPDYGGVYAQAAQNWHEDGTEAAPGPAAMCAVELPELRRGDASEAVRSMQTLLIARHFACGADGADGDFGPATRQAVLNFQGERALEATGTVGPPTWAALIAG